MRFGKTLRTSVYQPWKDKYIDYTKLKTLLREDAQDDDGERWTEEDENRFCDEIFNVQLEKVAQFQQERVDDLRARVEASFDELKSLTPASTTQDKDDAAEQQKPERTEEDTQKLRALEKKLDDIMNEVKELKKYSTINYTGFLKIVKKHDRKRGNRYRVRPMMQLSLAQRPFNSESGYSPLLSKLSIMYFAIREQLEEKPSNGHLDLETRAETHNGERYTAHKLWVHPDNLLEVKTLILRRLPTLVYSESSAKELDGNDAPAITSLYLDSPKFDLFTDKVDRQTESSSLRLRWYGQLSSRPEIFVEHKFADGSGNSHESKFTIKDKYVKSFLSGEYSMEKVVQKMEKQGQPAEQIEAFKKTVAQIQEFVQEKQLSPVLRANYKRTAFQNPADDRVRISIDHDVAFIREDTVDAARPCRDPNDWHRLDIDDSNMTYPFKSINQSEVSKFPFAILEIKLKEYNNRKRPAWVEELMTSHLVHPCPRFSKFVHGIASLFEDYVNNLPFWLSDLDTDIRKDPQKAFEEEEQRRAQRADDQLAVGSLVGAKSGSYKAALSSPVGKSYLGERMAAESKSRLSHSVHANNNDNSHDGDENGESSGARASAADGDETEPLISRSSGYGAISSVFPSFSITKYSRARKAQRSGSVQLPAGVVKPTSWIKNAGELKVEPKVWLANERTFLKWQHICILQGTLAIGLYSAAGKDRVAEVMGIVYILIAAFAGAWGYWMLRVRRGMVLERSGKDFDNMIGPIVISVAMMGALILNFAFQYRSAVARIHGVEEAASRDELR